MSEDTYCSMTELAQILGSPHTSHSVGKQLTTLGFRSDGKPTQKASDLGLVKLAPTDRGCGFFYTWNEQKTLSLLKQESLP